MRKNILLPWSKKLSYIIREIVSVADKVKNEWRKIYRENIWDPVEKWEKIPKWFKDIVKNAIEDDKIYWYSPTRW